LALAGIKAKEKNYILMDKLVTVATFQYPHEAYVLKGRLESEGIEVHLKDELTVQVYNFLTNAVGGVKLQVHESDFDRSLPILKDFGILENNSEQTESIFRKYVIKLMDYVPLFRNQTFEIRLILHVSLLLLISASVFIISQIPSKEERQAEIEEQQRVLKNEKFYEYYLPILDSLINNNPSEAIVYIDSLDTIYPENEELYSYLGVAYYHIDSFKVAIECFEKSMDYIGYKNAQGIANIALCKRELKDYDGAIAGLLEASNRNWSYWLDLAYVYEKKGDLQNAVEYFLKYIKKREELNPLFLNDSNFKQFKRRVDSLERIINQ